MTALMILLSIISLICALIGLMKFPWDAKTFREMSPADRSHFWNSLALVLIPLLLTAICVWGTFAESYTCR